VPDFLPDIFIFGLQEICPLTAKSIIIKDSKRVEEWNQILAEALKHFEE
jgi:hypothetical protein